MENDKYKYTVFVLVQDGKFKVIIESNKRLGKSTYVMDSISATDKSDAESIKAAYERVLERDCIWKRRA